MVTTTRLLVIVASLAMLSYVRADEVHYGAQILQKAGFPDVSKLELHMCKWNKPFYAQGESPVATNVFFVLDAGKKQVLGWNGVPLGVSFIGPRVTIEGELGAALKAPVSRFSSSTDWPALSAQPLAVEMLELDGEGVAARKLLSRTLPTPASVTASAGDFWLRCLRTGAVRAFCDDTPFAIKKTDATRRSGFARAKTRFQTIQKAARVLPKISQSRFDYPTEAAQILADIARRETDTSPPSEEVARLIWNLQNVRSRQMSSPGDIIWREDQTIEKLVQLGDKALPALLDCAQNDDRLTLSYRDSRGDSMPADIAPVSEAAQRTVEEILGRGTHYSKLPYNSSTAKARREDVAAQLRAEWESVRDLAPLDRFWTPFLSNTTSAQRLLEAATQLTDRSPLGSPYRLMGTDAPMRGEGLRARQKPTLSDLFERQILRLSNKEDIESANQLAELYAQWDLPRAAPFLGAQLKRTALLVKASSETDSFSWPDTQLNFLAARVQVPAENAAALRDYAAFLHGRGFGTLRDESYEPLTRFAADPSMKSAAAELFGGNAKPFQDALTLKNDFVSSTQVLTTLYGPLMTLPIFKNAVLRELSNRKTIGFLKYDTPTEAAIDVSAWEMQGFSTDAKLRRGEKRPLRVCDLVGYGLMSGQTDTRTPLLNLALSEKARDARLKKIAAMVRANKTVFDSRSNSSAFH